MFNPARIQYDPRQIHVAPLESPRSGDAVKNQYTITAPGFRAFQSYNSLIAVYDREDGRLTLGRDWDYSVTTAKYLHVWLRENFPHWDDIRSEYAGRTGAETIRKAIAAGCIGYDENMR